MTMHLQQGLSTINTRKRKVKFTKAKMAEYEVRWRKHNKWAKQNNMPDLKYATVQQYIDYCFGKTPMKDVRLDRSTYKPEVSYAQQRIAEFNKKYPSSSTIVSKSKGDGENAEWQKEKQKISATYTIAPAYNKGAYQVVPKNEVKHIGK
jgi:nucleoside-specific outer membrane channel protein Tsx